MHLAECKLPGIFFNFDLMLLNTIMTSVCLNFVRMRNYVKRGSVSSRIDYAKLREKVWEQVYSLDKEGVVFHDNDIQYIAMKEAQSMNLLKFTVNMSQM